MLLYVKDHFTAKVLFSTIVHRLEILPVEICDLSYKFCITIFIGHQIHPVLFLIGFIVIKWLYFFNFVLLGDFNVDMTNQLHPLHHKVCSLMNYFQLPQAVTDSTHTAPSSSILP